MDESVYFLKLKISIYCFILNSPSSIKEMGSTMDYRKQCLVHSIVNFLQTELSDGNLNDEKKESVEVAIQCLETAFDLDRSSGQKYGANKIDLLSFISEPEKSVVTEEQKKKAEECKNKGNAHMKNSEFNEAVSAYSNAIELNPYNAVYFCNRAAAYSKLDQHTAAIDDCKQAIALDPSYGKAYGRLGIAYSNLNKYQEAHSAYENALKFDPGNTMYETNLKLAEETLYADMESAAPPEHTPVDISQFINNPNLINMATQMLSDSNFRNLMSGLMNMSQSGDPNLDVLFQAGQTLASRMQTADPNFVENLRRSLDPQANLSNMDNGDPKGPSKESGSKG